MNSFYKRNLALLLLTFMTLYSCEQDEILSLEHEAIEVNIVEGEGIITKSFDVAQTKSLQGFLIKRGITNTKTSQNGHILELPIGKILLESGFGIVNEDDGKITYTFSLIPYDTVENKIFNFIFKQDLDYNVLDSYIKELS